MTVTITGTSHLRAAVLSGLAMFAVLSAAQAPPSASAAPAETPEDVPAAVDLRPLFADVGLTVRAQGPRNTCSVFTVVGAMEYALARQDGAKTRLSVEFLNWASNAAISERQDGGYFSDLWKGYEAFGVCDETDEPYRTKFDPELRPGKETLKTLLPKIQTTGTVWRHGTNRPHHQRHLSRVGLSSRGLPSGD